MKTGIKIITSQLSEQVITNVLTTYTNVLTNELTTKRLSAILCAGWSRKPAGALCCMLSIHSPADIFMVLVSIFISKTHNHF